MWQQLGTLVAVAADGMAEDGRVSSHLIGSTVTSDMNLAKWSMQNERNRHFTDLSASADERACKVDETEHVAT